MKSRFFLLIRVSDQAGHDVRQIIEQGAMARAFEVKNVFQLIIDGFNDAAFTQHQLIKGVNGLGFPVLFQGGNQLNTLAGPVGLWFAEKSAAQKHRIAITEESIRLIDSVLIGPHNGIITGKC
jgi:hypothetical protein